MPDFIPRNAFSVAGYSSWVDSLLSQEPCWEYNSPEGTEARNHIIQCVLERMRKCIKKPVNYEKVKGVTQEEKENTVLFRG